MVRRRQTWPTEGQTCFFYAIKVKWSDSYRDLILPPEACLPEAAHILYRRGKLGRWSLLVLTSRPPRSERRPSYLKRNKREGNVHVEIKHMKFQNYKRHHFHSASIQSSIRNCDKTFVNNLF